MKLSIVFLFYVSTRANAFNPVEVRPLDEDLDRIIGGIPVEQDEYPFYGVSDAAGFCGCSLIHPDILLTAAHCASAFSPGQTVSVGGIQRSGSDGTTVTARQQFSHPLYESEFRFDYDFMLIKIDENLSGVPTPAWNAGETIPAVDETTVNFGFGLTEDGDISQDLLKVQLAIVSQDECDAAFPFTTVTDRMLCAGPEFGRSSCNGDSGSPLMYNDEIVGVVSWGSNNCGGGTPSVFARTSQADLFIKEGICTMTEVTPLPDYCDIFTQPPTVAPTVTPPPPANDACDNALPLVIGQKTMGSTMGATFDDVGFCGTINSGPGVWYTLQGDGRAISLSTCENTSYDTRITVFSGDCNNPVCVTGNDQAQDCGLSTGGSRAEWESEEGVNYLVLVHGNFDLTGLFELDVATFVPPVPPSNDECTDALLIEPGTTVEGNTQLATTSVGFDVCDLGVLAPGVWYKATGTGNTFTASTCDGTFFDTILTVVNSCDAEVATCVAENDDACISQSQVSWDTVPGEEYYILVHGYFESDFGPFQLDLVESGTPSGGGDTLPPVSVPVPAPVPVPTPSSLCEGEDFENECRDTSQCRDIYPDATDCSRSSGGVCFCGDDVCGCL